MTTSDPIADLLTRIRNGCQAAHRFIEVPSSKQKLALVKVLKAQGFIEGFLVKEDSKQGIIRVYLKYSRRRPVIHGLTRVSKPGQRKYVGYRDVPKVLGGMGIAVLSTPVGLLEGLEARKAKVGGELICYVW